MWVSDNVASTKQAVQVDKNVTWTRGLFLLLLLLRRAGKGEEAHQLILVSLGRDTCRGEVYMLIETGEIRILDP